MKHKIVIVVTGFLLAMGVRNIDGKFGLGSIGRAAGDLGKIAGDVGKAAGSVEQAVASGAETVGKEAAAGATEVADLAKAGWNDLKKLTPCVVDMQCPTGSVCATYEAKGVKCIKGCRVAGNCGTGQYCKGSSALGFKLGDCAYAVHYYDSMATNANIAGEQIDGVGLILANYKDYGSYEVWKGQFNPPWFSDAKQWTLTKTGVTGWPDHINFWEQNAETSAFVEKYNIDMSDYDPSDPMAYEYKNFEKFFYRKLGDRARKIDMRPDVVVSPADSKLRIIQNVSGNSKFFIKQKPFDLKTFLGDRGLANQYEGGTLMVFRLAPTDYHRFHFPFDNVPTKAKNIDGKYDSVSPIAFEYAGLWPISTNKRARITLQSDTFGDVIMMVVGASVVGSLNFTPYDANTPVKKGDEAGFFAFGGSTVCLLFKKDAITVPDVLAQRSILPSDISFDNEIERPFESVVRMGEGVAMEYGADNVNMLSDPRYVNFLNKKTPGLTLNLDGTRIPFKWNRDDVKLIF